MSGITRGVKDWWKRVLALPRDDAEAAAALYREIREAEGEVPEDVARTLVMLQDDPTKYFRLLRD